jgi:uncharacterized protein involved in exopolysaccharide biosynthesis
MEASKDLGQFRDDSEIFDLHVAVKRVRAAIAKHIPLVITCIIFALALLVIYVKLFPPIYKAEVMLTGESREDEPRAQYYALWNVFRKSDIKSEPALITSRAVAKEVVGKLNLKFDDVHHSILTHIGYLWTESWLGKTYRKVKERLYPPDPSEYNPTAEEIERARTIEAFKDSFTLEAVGNTTVGLLVVKAPTYKVSEYANTIVDVFIAERRRQNSDEADGAYNSLKAELNKAKSELEKIEKVKLDFDRRNSLTVEFERDKVLLNKWGELRSAIIDKEAQNASLKASLKLVEDDLAREPREIVSVRSYEGSRVRAMLQAREFELANALKALMERYRPDSPEVLETQRLLADTRAALVKEPERSELSQSKILNPAYENLRSQRQTTLTQIEANEATLAKHRIEFKQLSDRMDAMPTIFAQLHIINRERAALEARYKLIQDRYMMAEVSRSAALSAPSILRVIDYASPPMKQNWPNLKLLIPATIVIGMILGIGLAIVIEVFSGRATRDRLSGRRDLPVYAAVRMQSIPNGDSKRNRQMMSHTSALQRIRL